MVPSSHLTVAEMTHLLAFPGRQVHDFRQHSTGTPKSAAVLVPLLWDGGEWHLLFTRRTDTVHDHKGQVSFPGGGSEPHDPTPEATALRETFEEIGIKPKDVRTIGQLVPMVTITHFSITPVVGIIPWPVSLSLSTDEVSRAFTIPLHWLAQPENHQVKTTELDGHSYQVVYFSPFDGETLWGITARITLTLLERFNLIHAT